MSAKPSIPYGQPVGFKLSPTEREFLLNEIILLDGEIEEKLRDASPEEGEVVFTLDDLDELAGSIAAEANHTEDAQVRRKLERVYDRIRQVEKRLEEA